jgi:hypothetical protein
VIESNVVDNAFLAMLVTASSRPIGDADVPSLTPNLPYAIVYPTNSPTPTPQWGDPMGMQDFNYHIKCVGKSRKQTRWMSDRIKWSILRRATNGTWANDIDLPGASAVVNREVETAGAIMRSGDLLFEVNDYYRLQVHAFPGGEQ